MTTKTKIEWTEVTWNPVTGCSKISPGCKHCYAERMAKRLKAMKNPRYLRGFEVVLHDDLLDVPRRWRSPRRVFVNSMSDVFHDAVPEDYIQRMFVTIAECPQHTFQILTKRSGRLTEMAASLVWPANLWMGVSLESKDYYHRITDLSRVPAVVRFLSCEPLLGPLDDVPLDAIDWVIVGGESGPGARPMHPNWVESIRQRCRESRTAFFFKQWGGVRKDLTGRELHGRTYDEQPAPRIATANPPEHDDALCRVI